MTNPTQAERMEQWVNLTKAIQALADREPAARPPGSGPTSVPAAGAATSFATDVELTRQRIDFGYRALGALTGRVGEQASDFVVPLVEARRFAELLLFRGLPHGADWVEVRRDRKVELRRIRRFRLEAITTAAERREATDGYDTFEAGDAGAEADSEAHRGRGLGVVRLRDFTPAESIGSLLFLDTRRGPVLALGPRLGPATRPDVR